MTQKHFAAIASAINAELRAAIGSQEHHREAAIRALALTVARNLADVAPKFKQARFLAACVEST